MVGTVLRWLDDRTGLPSAVRHFLEEPIPRSAGWRNTLGSIVGALLLFQILSGFLMTLFYVPHPDAAYRSVEYIKNSISGGTLIHALHYWGASFIVVALFVHVCRVFYSGAYKKPREATWLVGLVLLVVVCALAFTGQLLPYTQEGYWAAKVGIQIASSAPIAGPYIDEVLTGGNRVGALTLTRFYAVHVVFLPALLGLLVAAHLTLLRKHGPVRPARDRSTETVPFFPYQLFKDMVGITLVLAGLFAVAWLVGGPQTEPLDTTDTSYIPHPEWYFMSHFQILKLTPGRFKIMATFVLPTTAGAVLALLPWLDRSASTAWRQRRTIVTLGTAAIVGVVVLTAWGTAELPEEHQPTVAATEARGPVEQGRMVFRRQRCQTCHRVHGIGKSIGPDLSNIGDRLKPEYMKAWLQDPSSFKPQTVMPPTKASPAELDDLVAYLQSLHKEKP